MKTLSAIVALLFSLIAFSAHAQSGMISENWRDIKLGPFITGGLALNTGSVDSLSEAKSGLALAVGAEVYYPFSVMMGFNLGLCYDARSIKIQSTANNSQNIAYSAGYIALRPELNIGGITLGLGLGLPISANATLNGFGSAMPSTPPFAVSTSDLNMLLEGRLGAAVKLDEGDKGQLLQLLLQGSYGFNTLIKKDAFSSSYNDDLKTKNNGPIATVEIGVAYLFDLTPH
jgi:hypothetical protein